MSGQILCKTVGKAVPERETWASLLDHWHSALNQYMDLMEGDDLPQWYNERSHVGFLAAAVWKMGGVALEEYSTFRQQNNTSAAADSTPGRCDLYFNLENLDCVVESKVEWCSNYSTEDAQRVRTKLEEAGLQLLTLPKEERAEHGVVLCWALPWIKSGSGDEASNMTAFANQFEGDLSIVCVYYVDMADRKEAETRYEKQQRSYPGIILVGKAFSAFT